MINYDMHVHSTYSDGTLKVNEIIEICKIKKLIGVSITDHDTISAYKDVNILNLKDNNIDIIPGLELSTSYENIEVHILGYYIDCNNIKLNNILNKLKDFRLHRLKNMIEKLNALGYRINEKEVLKTTNENASVGRPHIARCLVQKGYFKNTKDAFDKILGNGKPAHIERFKLTPKEGIDLIKDAGGIPILAHPYVSKTNKISNLKAFLNDMLEYGIMGIEVFHSLHSKLEEGYLLNYANKNNLLITGGSDCHEKFNSSNEFIIGTKGISLDRITNLKSAR